MADIREDLEGLKVRMPGTHTVYLIDQGKKRAIDSSELYWGLFSTMENIHLDLDVDEIESGEPIPEEAILFRCYDSPKVFLLDKAPDFVKRHVANPQVMSRYEFAWSRIHVWNVPLNVINIPDGVRLTKTGIPH